MRAILSGFSRRRIFMAPAALSLLALLWLLTGASPSPAQTPQPWLFAGTEPTSQASGLATFLRDDTTGALSLLPGTAVTFQDQCLPTTLDPKGRFLYGVCANGLAMYTLDSTTGMVAEVPSSPFEASSNPFPDVVVAESTGQFVYLLKSDFAAAPANSVVTLDTFQVQAQPPALLPLTSQPIPVTGSWVGAVADPNKHGLAIYLNQEAIPAGQYPTDLLYIVTFDPNTGAATLDPSNGRSLGNRGLGISISSHGNYLALGYGATQASLSIFTIDPNTFTLTLLATDNLGGEITPGGVDQHFPQSIFFDPTGEITYVQVPDPTSGSFPFQIMDTATFLILPSSPLSVSNASFLGILQDRQGPFVYGRSQSNGSNGINVYQVDPGTGQASQPGPISSPFYIQPYAVIPLVAAVGPGGQQNTVGPVLTPSALSLTFPETIAGQSSTPAPIVLTSNGDQSVTFTSGSISIEGSNPSDFTETDNCISTVVLQPKHACTILVTYAPTSSGPSQATLNVVDNAQGSPQQFPLSGNASKSTPAVSLNPPGAFNLPGTTTEGTTSAPQTLTLTNSGLAPLHITSLSLGGFDFAEFSLGSSNCVATIAPGASCTIPISFSPVATGIRTTTLTILDDAANSPQTETINGTAVSAVAFSASVNGNTTATVSAGQTAQYNLQAQAGSGFSGTLTFVCTGAPTGAACTPPASVAMSNGAVANFTIVVTTSGASAAAHPGGMRKLPSLRADGRFALCALCAGLLLVAFLVNRERSRGGVRSQIASQAATLAAILFAFSAVAGCGSGGGKGTGGTGSVAPTNPTQPTVTTPSGTYTLVVTPLATASGSGTNYQVPVISLTLNVN
jgi:hypothetical protein